MDERAAAILDAVRALPATTLAATMRNPRSSADRTFRGPTLYDYAVSAGLFPADLERGALANGYFLFTAEDGARSAVALAEVWPGASTKDVILAYEQDGEPIRNGVRLVITGDYLGGRSIGGLVSIEAKTAEPSPAPPAQGLELAGLLDRPGPVDLDAIDPAMVVEVETLEATGHRGDVVAPRHYRGPRLYALLDAAGIQLDPAQHEDFVGKVVVATGADGLAVVIAGGEIEPRFMDGAAILAMSRDGVPLADEGGVRLMTPFDRRPSRWAKGITRVELRQA